MEQQLKETINGIFSENKSSKGAKEGNSNNKGRVDTYGHERENSEKNEKNEKLERDNKGIVNSLAEKAGQFMGDLKQSSEEVAKLTEKYSEVVTSYMKKRPMLVIFSAAGIGFFAGCFLTRKLFK